MLYYNLRNRDDSDFRLQYFIRRVGQRSQVVRTYFLSEYGEMLVYIPTDTIVPFENDTVWDLVVE